MPDDAGGGPTADVVAVEPNRPLGDPAPMVGQEPADGPQHGRLAGTVGPEQGDDGATRNLEAHAPQRQDDIAVDDFEILE